MQERIILSNEEKALLQKHLDKFERDAKRGKGMRYFLGGQVCFLLFFGVHCMMPVINSLHTDFDQQAFIERLGCEEIPDDVPFKYWIVGYVNKTAVFSEHNRRVQELRQFEGCLGLVFIATGIFGFAFLVNHWNDGKRNLLIAKIIQQHLNDLDGTG